MSNLLTRADDALSASASRRGFLKTAGAAAAAITAVTGLERLFKPTAAFAQGAATLTPTQVVMYAYALENLEKKFYADVIAGIGGFTLPASIAAKAAAAITSYGADEAQHVTDLRGVLSSILGVSDTKLAAIEGAAANPDYSKILGRDPFTDKTGGDLLLAAQIVEDLGVQAYKGQAANLLAAGDSARSVLAAALAIHSVEARHAAGIRYLRQLAGADVRTYIRTGDTLAVPTAETNRAGIDFSSEAFDGYATEVEVDAAVTPILRVPVGSLIALVKS